MAVSMEDRYSLRTFASWAINDRTNSLVPLPAIARCCTFPENKSIQSPAPNPIPIDVDLQVIASREPQERRLDVRKETSDIITQAIVPERC